MSKEILRSSVQKKEAEILCKGEEAVKGREGIVDEDKVVEAVP